MWTLDVRPAAAATINMCTLGTLFVLTPFLQSIQHRSPLMAGLQMIPLFAPLAIIAPLAGRLTGRIGPRLPIAAGLLTAAVGLGLLVGIAVAGAVAGPPSATASFVEGFHDMAMAQRRCTCSPPASPSPQSPAGASAATRGNRIGRWKSGWGAVLSGAVHGDEKFAVDSVNGALAGWCAGTGPPVMLLHGGPGLSFSYLDELADELAPRFRVASFQQRGLEPSTVEGPFTMAQAIDDVVRVLDGLGWERALVVGHSWGGHLALRCAAVHPQRLLGVLGIDPVGMVGDGGLAVSELEIVARIPRVARKRAREIQERAIAGVGTPEETLESLELLWPAYFADPENVPPKPPIDVSVDAYSALIDQVGTGTDQVGAELAKGAVPFGIVAGAASPIPWGQAARRTTELSPRAFLDIVPDAGHFLWLEAPGRVLAALRRLVDEVGASGVRTEASQRI